MFPMFCGLDTDMLLNMSPGVDRGFIPFNGERVVPICICMGIGVALCCCCSTAAAAAAKTGQTVVPEAVVGHVPV